MRLALALLCLPALAAAQAPSRLSYQGRLLRSDGSPEAGVVQLRFSFFAVPSGGSPLWAEDQSVALSDGFYSALLGEAVALPGDLFDGSERYLEVATGGSPLIPRHRVASVPYAAMASSARDLRGGTVEASSVRSAGKLEAGSIEAGAIRASSLTASGAVEAGPLVAASVKASGAVEAASLKSQGAADVASLAVGGKQVLDGTGRLDWSSLKNLPAGFADGTDDGGISEVAAAAPLLGKGTAASPLSLAAASSSSDGYLTRADWAAFSAKLGGVAAQAPLAGSGTAADPLKLAKASATTDGYLAAADYARLDAPVDGAHIEGGAVRLNHLYPGLLGHGGNLDADKLDGKHASDFLAATAKVDAVSVNGLKLATGAAKDGDAADLTGAGFGEPPAIFFAGLGSTLTASAGSVTKTSFKVSVRDVLGGQFWGCGNDLMFLYTESGGTLRTIDPPGSNTSGVAYDPTDATLWTVDQNNRLRHLSTDGSLLAEFPAAAYDMIAYDPSDDSLWASNSNNNQLAHLNKSGGLIATVTGGSGAIRGIAVDPSDHTLWLLNEANATVYHVSRTGAPLSGNFSLPLSNCHVGLVKHPDGTFWTSEQCNMRLYHLSSTGSPLGFVPTSGNPNFRGITLVTASSTAVVNWLAVGK